MAKEVPLTRGAVALVDDEDYELIQSMGKWHMSSTGYAVRRSRGVTIRMHRVLCKTPKGMVTDHLNHNRLDNRKSNLRAVTQKENSRNRKGDRNYCFSSGNGKWVVRHKNQFYGYYDTETQAQRAVLLARSGVERQPKSHPRRKYLPKGVYYMLSEAKRGRPAYYARPTIDGKRYFKGYFDNTKAAKEADELLRRRVVS